MIKTDISNNSWIISLKPNPQADLRLFCFPYAGGSYLIFRTWPDYLPPSVEVCAIELPGRGRQMKLPPYNKLEALVDAIASNIYPYLDKPFAFFGHSMGGLVSFELARLLRKRYGMVPAHLFISGRRAPQIPDTDSPIHNLPEPAFIEELRHLNGTPPAVLENAELMQLFLPILRSDFAVLETYTYTPEPPLECPITVFGGLQDSKVGCHEMQAWQEQTKADFNLHMFPGNHFFLHSSQSVLLEKLAKCLSQQLLA
ncbi:putative thioesterase (plasmid) [Nostoc sp. NIES-3756]|uniref:thioesterase II family protein n=1 Tax=Nostoc sp. NIES-3756 TaxID=1751286 RepID=UPI00072218CE|nr:thioesterase II family protein [Nostoc sp. NIES-3756]BAT56834.1 putative thioesterase [Nostoc sp. NIES-3756]BAY41868.1 putative thioesterase [Nostoc sp. NIES-2111]